MNLRGESALVTGAGKRLGRAIALALAREGAHVAIHFNTSSAEAEETARMISELGVKAMTVQGDLADASVPDRLISEVTEAMGGIAVLVNSASIFEETPWPVTDESWERHLAVNLTAPMRLIRAATPTLKVNRGVVINIVDASWQRPSWRRHAAYCVSKVALVGLTQNLARTLAPEIRVNGVAPGAVLPPLDSTEEERAEAISRVPLGRWGEADNVAEAVVHLIRNDHISGQILNVDGGRSVA